jgi:5-methyltetrahydropteroyltriglutamate--homocysteine methyltransferase
MNNTYKLPGRADHVGSLLRPPELTRAFKRHQAGDLDPVAFAGIQDDAIRDVIDLQQRAGLKSITDGEFRRASYWARFVERVDGLEVGRAEFKFHDEEGAQSDFSAPNITGPVRRNRAIAQDEFVFVRDTTTETAKITLPSPPTMHFWRLDKAVDPAIYPTNSAFYDDLATVYAQEIAALADLGATYVQTDEVPLAMLCDPAIRAKVKARGLEPLTLIDEYVSLFDAAFGARPPGVIAAVHLCRGNYKGRFLSEGGYDEVAERMFTGIPVDAFFLEYDTPRAGDFAPLRFVPRDRAVVLGLVSSKVPQLEDEDALVRRIEEATRYIDIDQLGLSPQCGFASTVGGNPVTLDDQKAKLELIVRVAERVWS